MWTTKPRTFDRICQYYPERIAIVDEGRRITPAQQHIKRVVSYLSDSSPRAWRTDA